jgi:hypothetical protein
MYKGLLAFGVSVLVMIVTFYGVVLRTQRVPNFLASIYSLFKWAIICIIISVSLLIILKLTETLTIVSKWSFYIYSGIILILAILLGYYLLKEYHKVFSFRYYYNWRENITALYNKNKKEKNNENVLYFTTSEIKDFCSQFISNKDKAKIIKLFRERKYRSLSAFCMIKKRIELDKTLIDLSYWALNNDFNLLYLSCQRHPIEFINLIEKKIKSNIDSEIEWGKKKKQLLIIDAHTSHFGFKEPEYYKKNNNLLSTGHNLIETPNFSFVGIHSAIVHGYETKLKTGERGDKPSLLIYDSCYALTDLENEKLYRIFLKHVIPSERLLGGNITIFAEQWLPSEMERFVKTTVDVEIRNKYDKQNWLKSLGIIKC